MDRLVSMAVFVKAVDAGSFAAAAAVLNLSSPMVGRHVRTLEAHLGVQLLVRTTRRQSLTDIGRTYYDRCKTVLAEVDAAEACAAEVRATPHGRLRVDAPVAFGMHRLAPALPDYLRAHPGVRVELTLNNRHVDLVEEGYDAVIRVGRLADSSLIARPLARYALVACASPDYLARRGVPLMPADLEGHACLGFRPGELHDTWTFDGLDGKVIPVRVTGPFSSNNSQAVLAAALAGLGVILQAEAVVMSDVAGGRLVPVLPDFLPEALPMHILFASGRRVTPKLRSFIDFVADRFGR